MTADQTADQTAPGGCPETGDRDLAAAYVAGRLDEPEAEAFEAHWFECDACWSRVKRAEEVRAAFRGVEEGEEGERPPRAAGEGPERGGRPGEGTPGHAPPDPGPIRRARRWLPVAAAAALVAVGFGIGDVVRRSFPAAEDPVYRGAGSTIDLDRAELGAAGVEVGWSAVPGADLYRVRLYDAEGRLLAEEESADTTVAVSGVPSAASRPGAPLYVQVEALDELREVIGRSSGVEVVGPASDGPPGAGPR